MATDSQREEEIRKHAERGHASALEDLLQQARSEGEDVQTLVGACDAEGDFPLSLAASRGHATCVSLLLHSGADPNQRARAPGGAAPLHKAATQGHLDAAVLLLEAGANAFLEDSRGQTALELAAANGRTELLAPLRAGARFTGWLRVQAGWARGREPPPTAECFAVVSPRFAWPGAGAGPPGPPSGWQLAGYSARDDCRPEWCLQLGGATAAVSRQDHAAFCDLSMPQAQAAAASAFTLRRPDGSASLRLWPRDGSAGAEAALWDFCWAVVEAGRTAPPAAAAALGPPPAGPSNPAPQGQGAADLELARHLQIAADEQYARTLSARWQQKAQARAGSERQGSPPPDAEPPSAAAPPTPAQPQPQPQAPAAQHPGDSEEGMCVICLSEPAAAGLLHGGSMHKCCCRACAEQLKARQGDRARCPLCQQRVELFVMAVFG